jgi:bifunctional non-homologous end joining protein LigD
MMRRLEVNGRIVEVTHPDRVLFPADGITKAELVDYYRLVARWMGPHLAGRPANLERFPDGIDRPGFFQQEMPEYFPDWIEGVLVSKAGGQLRHVVIRDTATLVYLANIGCITPHTWLSRSDQLDDPDQMIFDLDPTGTDVAGIADAARALRALLGELGLAPFVKTTGSRGYHVVVALDRQSSFDEVREVAKGIADTLVARYPEWLTTEPRKARRRGRIYLDTLRNAYAHTAVPPFAVRARLGAPVAFPISWEELDDPAMHPARFTIRNALEMLEHREDPWAALGTSTRPLADVREALQPLLAESRPAKVKLPRQAVTGTQRSKPSAHARVLGRATDHTPPR